MDFDTVNGNPFPPSSYPSPPSPTVPLLSPSNDECFCCKRQGHWAKDCPNKTPRRSSLSSPSNASVNSSLRVRCPCGHGFCRQKTSKTLKNPDRGFYTCRCGFFIWSDELNSIVEKAPICPCGVGTCSVNGVYTTNPAEAKWYYACRIRKNMGACEFFQWADSGSNNTVEKNGNESKADSSLQSRFISSIKDLSGTKEMRSDMNAESPRAQSSESSMDLPNVAIHLHPDEIPGTDLVMPEAEFNDLATRRQIEVFQPMTQFENRCVNVKDSLKLISVAGNIITRAVLYQILGLHVYGWLGRLAYPPSQCPKDPPTGPIFCCIFPNFDPILSSEDTDLPNTASSSLLPRRAPNGPSHEIGRPPSKTRRQVTQFVGGVSPESLRFEDCSVAKQGPSDYSKLFLKKYGRTLLEVLECMDPIDQKKMQRAAGFTFKNFEEESIECGPFIKGVEDFIRNVSLLASIRESTHDDDAQEIIKLHEIEKVQFEKLSYLQAEAENAYKASYDRLESLHNEISRVRSNLAELEKQLVVCEAETSLFKSRANEVSDKVSESKIRMEIESCKMTEVLELEQRKESARDAARLALETARTWLEEQ